MEQTAATTSATVRWWPYVGLCLVAALVVFGARLGYVLYQRQQPFVAQSTNFKLEPPADSLIGIVGQTTGTVTKISRGESDPQPATPGAQLQSGEVIATQDDSSAVLTFPNQVQFQMSGPSQITISSSLAENFLIKQANGKVKYILTNPDRRVSVRSQHALFYMETGQAFVISNENTRQITIEMVEGRGQIGLVDLNNETHVWGIEAGQRAVIDDRERTLRLE